MTVGRPVGRSVGRPVGRPITGYASGGADPYIINGLTPQVVADFAGVKNTGTPLYRDNAANDSFASMFDYTGASNKTMVDSDGLLKWAPHNLALQSQSLGSWTNQNTTDSGQILTASVGATFHCAFTSVGMAAGEKSTVAVNLTRGTHDYVYLALVGASAVSASAVADLALGTITETDDNGSTLLDSSITENADGTYTIRVVGSPSSVTSNLLIVGFAEAATGNTFDALSRVDWVGSTAGTETVTINAAWGYKSSLGGMVEVPLDERGLASDATYVPTTTAARYLPRRDSYRYNGTSFVRKGLRLESEQRTNLFTQSNDFGNAAWSKTSCTVTQNATGLDGATSAWTLEADGSGAVLSQGVTVATSTANTYSIVAKAGTTDWIAVIGQNFTTPGAGRTWFNVATGTLGTVYADHTASITEIADGKYLCSITFTTDAADTTGEMRIIPVTANNDFTGGAGENVIIEHAQFEAGSTPSSRIITGASSATRAAETLTIAAAKMSYDSAAMWFQVQGEMDYADNDTAIERVFYNWLVDTSNRIFTRLETTAAFTGTVAAFQSAAGTTDVVKLASEYTPGLNVPFNIASRNTSGAINAAKDGVAGTADTTPSALPDLSATIFELAPDFMGHISLSRQGTGDPGDAGIEEATA